MLSEQDIAEINKVIAARGYLVMASVERYEPGDIVRNCCFRREEELLGQPLRVISETNYDDLDAQVKMLDRKGKRNGVRKNFYRVVTD